MTITLAQSFNPHIKVIGTGLGLGPFKSKFSLIIFKLFVAKFNYLFVRETESQSIVKNLNVEVTSKLLGDDVILLLPYLNQEKKTSNLNSIAALNLKFFPDYNYSLIKGSVEDYLRKSLNSQNSQVEYFCFGREPGPDDRSLLAVFDRDIRDSLIVRDPYEDGWLRFLENLSRVRVGLGCAYHFTIVLTLFNIPTVGIYSGSYYKQKIVRVMQLLSQNAVVLSLDELALGKDVAEVLNIATNAHVSVNTLEQMYEAMRQEYVNVYESILS